MQIVMYRFVPGRRANHKIFAFGAGKSLRLDLGKPAEVDDELGYKILAECSAFVKRVEPPKAAAKAPEAKPAEKKKVVKKTKVVKG